MALLRKFWTSDVRSDTSNILSEISNYSSKMDFVLLVAILAIIFFSFLFIGIHMYLIQRRERLHSNNIDPIPPPNRLNDLQGQSMKEPVRSSSMLQWFFLCFTESFYGSLQHIHGFLHQARCNSTRTTCSIVLNLKIKIYILLQTQIFVAHLV